MTEECEYLPEPGKYAMTISFTNGTRKEGGQATFSLITSENGLDLKCDRIPSLAGTNRCGYVTATPRCRLTRLRSQRGSLGVLQSAPNILY